MALPAVPEDPDLQVLLAPLGDKVISAWSFDALSASWRGYNPATPELSDLNFLVPGVGYWIQMNESAEWVLSGSPTRNASESAEGLQLKNRLESDWLQFISRTRHLCGACFH